MSDELDFVDAGNSHNAPMHKPKRRARTKSEETQALIAEVSGKVSQPVASGIQRNFGSQVQIHHDLYKLKMAKFKRDMSWNATPQIEDVEHVHFFHTFDSDGKKHIYSTATGGHFHLLEVTPGVDGQVPIVRCVSGPLRFVNRRIKGVMRKVAEPVNENLEDEHMHEVSYLRSNSIAKRDTNTVATGIIAADAQKTAPIPGVS